MSTGLWEFACHNCRAGVLDPGRFGESTCGGCGLVYRHGEGIAPTPESIRRLVATAHDAVMDQARDELERNE